jgi:hypothetical protein
MAKRRKRRTGPKRVTKWTAEEKAAWLDFLQGRSWFPPNHRSIASVVARLRGFEGTRRARAASIAPTLEALPDHVRHVAGLAVFDALRGVRHTRENQLRDMSEAICRIACGDVAFVVSPEAKRSHARPSEPEPDLFGTPRNAPERHAIFDLPDDVLHAAIISTRRSIAAAYERPKRKRA